TSEIPLFLGCIIYGCSIWLIAQIFNIESFYPDGFWFWAVGSLIFSWRSRTPLIPLLVVSVTFFWIATLCVGFGTFTRIGGWYVADIGWSFPILTAIGLAWAYGYRSRGLLQGLIFLIAAWFAFWLAFLKHGLIGPFAVLVFGVLSAVFIAVGKATDAERTGNQRDQAMADPWYRTGAGIAVLWLLVLSFEDIWGEVFRNWGEVFNLGHCNGPAFSCSPATEIWLAGTMAVAVLVLAVIGVVFAEWYASRLRAKRSREDRGIHVAEVLSRQWLSLTIVGERSFWFCGLSDASYGLIPRQGVPGGNTPPPGSEHTGRSYRYFWWTR
ncbi:MAG: DUF2157 domain-containing protein, partial [Planctomycetia bacterium]|nr:DUF2157 domain-containing protein [Planctomycetia bacterium]